MPQKAHLSMARKIDWDNQIGRRLKLRDLHVFVTVARRGSMAKAAEQLGVSPSAVSEVISALEYTLGLRLLDRSPQGIEPNVYGRTLLKRCIIVFDELRQGISDLEFLTDPAVGEIRIGCAESISSTILPPVIQQFFQQYPRVALNVHRLSTPTLELPELRERSLDMVLARIVTPRASGADDVDVEVLFDDELVLAAGAQNRWAHRRKLGLAELVNEPWILTPPNTWCSMILTEAFRARGLNMPKACLTTLSVPLRANLLETGPYITAFPNSVLRLDADRFSLNVLPVDLSIRPWPVAIVTLKNRTLSPVAQRFIDHLRTFTTGMTAGSAPTKKSA
jgi:DNA-binding transcriptional LysR family regulator